MLDYLTIPGAYFFFHSFATICLYFIATSVNIEWTFFCGCLVLSHVWSQLTTQIIHVLLCLGCWSLGLVKDKDVLLVVHLSNLEGKEELEDT